MTTENVTITETAPDGTETKVEITQTTPDDSKSIIEEVVEALFDTGPGEAVEIDDLGEFTVDGYDAATVGDASPGSETVADADAEANAAEAAGVAETEAAAESEAHAQAARDAQEAADRFVAEGDYEAAAQARGTAESEAWAAGDLDALHGSGSAELESAATRQENAEYYERQEAWHAQHGEYDAARDDARAAATETGWADHLAGGEDHTGQATKEAEQMDWAVWEEGNAAYHQQNAEWYAEHGDLEQAEASADLASEHQAEADYHGDLGEHGGDLAVYDASSDVELGGSYDPPETETGE